MRFGLGTGLQAGRFRLPDEAVGRVEVVRGRSGPGDRFDRGGQAAQFVEQGFEGVFGQVADPGVGVRAMQAINSARSGPLAWPSAAEKGKSAAKRCGSERAELHSTPAVTVCGKPNCRPIRAERPARSPYMFVTPAYAQAAGAGAAGGGMEMVMSILPFVLIFVIMYFLIIRPQRQQMKKREEMLKNIRRGDQVVTGGGIIGKVTKVIDDKEVEIEIAEGTRIRAARSTALRGSRQGRARQGVAPIARYKALLPRRAQEQLQSDCQSDREFDASFCPLEDNPDLARRAGGRRLRASQRPSKKAGGQSAGLGAAQPDDARPRPSGRLLHPAAGRPRRHRQGPAAMRRSTTCARILRPRASAIPGLAARGRASRSTSATPPMSRRRRRR